MEQRNALEKTFLIRSPFIIFNKTNQDYLVNIIMPQSKEERVRVLKPGEGYPLSSSELAAKVKIAQQ